MCESPYLLGVRPVPGSWDLLCLSVPSVDPTSPPQFRREGPCSGKADVDVSPSLLLLVQTGDKTVVPGRPRGGYDERGTRRRGGTGSVEGKREDRRRRRGEG